MNRLFSKAAVLLCALLSVMVTNNPVVATTTTLRADGVMLVNGEPFFPFGFYYDGYNIPKATRLNDLAIMGGGGFNAIATNIDNEDGPLFASAAGLSMGVFMEFNDPNDTILQQVDRWRNNPALYVWQIADDVDNGRKTPASVRAQHDAIRAVDPDHLTYASGGHVTPGAGHEWIGNFMGVSDLLAMQSYPIPGEQLSATNSTLRKFYEAAPANKALLANTQAFRWEGERAPTPLEARNMTYLAYINGMKGIMFYSFRTDYFNLPENLPLWNQFKALAQENAIIRPWLLNGAMTRQVDTGPQRYKVFCSYWQYQGKLYIMFANTTNNNLKTEVTLPEGTVGPATPLFAGTPSGMSFTNATRKLSGTVQKQAVHVYQLDRPESVVRDWSLY